MDFLPISTVKHPPEWRNHVFSAASSVLSAVFGEPRSQRKLQLRLTPSSALDFIDWILLSVLGSVFGKFVPRRISISICTTAGGCCNMPKKMMKCLFPRACSTASSPEDVHCDLPEPASLLFFLL